MKQNTLSMLSIGSKAKIKRLNHTGNIRRRLLDIGLVPGTSVTCVLESPSGDPAAYLIRGAVIAIRKCDTEKIEIEGVQCQK